MGDHAYRMLAKCLAVALVATGCQEPRAGHEVPESNPAAIDTLISRLGDPHQDWAASARLQKLGQPAIEALVARLRQDPFADYYHGNHSPTMKALEKIGEPSLAVLAAALTPLLQSTERQDLQYMRSTILVMARINRGRAAESLIRIARSETDPTLRAEALEALLGREGYAAPLSITSRWEPCFGPPRFRAPCPKDPDTVSMTRTLQPMLPEIAALLKEAPTPRIRLASAQILGRWGGDDFKNQGENQLIALVMAESSVRRQAIQALGMLRVRSSSGVLKKQVAGSDDELKLAIAESLFRLNDPGYFAIVSELMSSKKEDTRRWAIQLARYSHNTAFVPRLIDRLQDAGWNGITTSTWSAGHEENVLHHPLAEDAAEALGRLTFQDFGTNAELWHRWWETNKTTSWESLLSQFVQNRLTDLPSAEPYTANQWMTHSAEADSPAVLRFVEAFLNDPRLDLGRVGPNLFSGGGDPPPILPLLLELENRNSAAARHLLYECLAAKDYALRQYCPFAVAVFDRQRALDWLVAQLKDRDPWVAAQAARSLVYLGDARGIPTLIDELGAKESARRAIAYDTLKHYTQEDIPFDPEAPVATRSDVRERWRQWWHESNADFIVKVRAAQIDSEVYL
jgi:HEAT repeat protein